MAVKRYNGTSWDIVAGLGAQGAAATSSSITTWVKTATGGETSLTGSSDSSTTLAYTPGQEQVFINGVLQVRGSDYTATNGTSITGLTALVAGDIATVTTVNAFSVTGAVPLSTVTANGDLIVGTSSGAVGRLGVGSTGNVLTVSGGVPTWAAPAGGGKLLQLVSATFNTETDVSSTTYTDSGLTATITPTSASSRIYIQISAPFFKNATSANNGVKFRIMRGATQVEDWIETSLQNSTATNNSALFGINYVDSPATTSATTYKLQFANVTASAFVRICSGGDLATIQLLEIGA